MPRKKKPSLLEQAVDGAGDALRETVEATGEAIRTTAETVGEAAKIHGTRASRAITDATVRGLGVVQEALADASPAARQQYVAANKGGSAPIGQLLDEHQLQISAPILPPALRHDAPPEEIQNTFRRAAGLPLPIAGAGDWPAVDSVQTVRDLPRDNRVADPRPSASYLPYMEALFGVPRQYMQRLLGKESPRDTMDEKNPLSSATGPGQTINSTFIRMMREHGAEMGVPEASKMSDDDVLEMRDDRRYALAVTARYQVENADSFRSTYARDPTWAELRRMHFFGDTNDFHRFQSASDDEMAAKYVSRAVLDANPNVFMDRKTGAFRTVGGVKKVLHEGWPDTPFTATAKTSAAPSDNR